MSHVFTSVWRLGLVALLALPTVGHAQSIGIGTSSPNSKAALDISATDKGLLIPRMDSAQRVAIVRPPAGLLVFQTNGRTGIWYSIGGAWHYIPDQARARDNLGNHTATRPLLLNGQPLTNTGAGGLRIDSAGRVGIGTAAPAAPMHVNGTAAVNTNVAGTGVTAQSSPTSRVPLTHIIDNSLTTVWTSDLTSAEQWISLDLGTPRPIRSYRVATPAQPALARGWRLQYSDDRTTWATAHTVPAATAPVGSWGSYSLGLRTAHRYYRLLFPLPLLLPTGQPVPAAAVAEWELRETPDVPSGPAVRIGTGTLQLEIGAAVRGFSTDGTLGAAADDAVPTAQAVKTYVDAHSTDNLGDHLATQNLQLGPHQLTGNSSATGLGITAAGTVQVPALAGAGVRPVQANAAGELVAAPPIYSSPATPLAALGTAMLFDKGRKVVVHGTRGLVLCADSVGLYSAPDFIYQLRNCVLNVLDLSTPTAPRVVGAVGVPNNTQSFASTGDYAYVPEGSPPLLKIYDVATVGTPVVGTVPVPGQVNDLTISGSRLYVIAGGQLRVYDISSPASPQLLGSMTVSGWQLAVEGNTVCVISSSQLTVYDLTSPGIPPSGVLNLPGNPRRVAVRGGRAYVAIANTLYVVDISTVTAPQALGTVTTAGPGPVLDVQATADRVFATSGSSLRIFDLRDPGAFRALEAISTPGWARALAVSGDYAYVAANIRLQAYRYATPHIVSVFPDGSLNALPLSNLFSLTQPLVLNDYDLRLRQATDPNHGLGFYGPGKRWNTQSPDGPVLYGNGGGVLGVNAGGTKSSVLTWTGAGRVGIGTASPQASLHVVGTLRVTNLPFGDYKNVQWNVATGEFCYDNSSRRYKTRIAPLHGDFAALLRLTPVTYERAHTPGRRELGFIAEQADSLGLTPLVEYDSLGRPAGYNYEKSVVYLTALLAEERAARLTAEAALTDTRRRLADLEATTETRLRRLEAAASGQARRP